MHTEIFHHILLGERDIQKHITWSVDYFISVLFVTILIVKVCLCVCVCLNSGPLLALGLAREDAIQGWRGMLGPQDVEEAKTSAPDR